MRQRTGRKTRSASSARSLGSVAVVLMALGGGGATAGAEVARAGLVGAQNRSALPANGSSMRGLTGRGLTGRVLVSNVLLAPDVAANPALLPAQLQVERPVVAQSLGFWRLHLLAFLERPVQGEVVTLVADDITDPGQRRPVKTFEIAVEPGSRTLQLNDFVVVESMGFAPGHTYDLTVLSQPSPESGLADAGKPDVYAKGVVTLR